MKVRSLFLSDLHLGSRACQASNLLDFLADCEAESIYLVGDIIDGWRLSARWYWPETHHAVLELLVSKARNGTSVIYIPGNHDEFVLESQLLEGLGFSIQSECAHTGVDGASYLVLHGDKFDVVERHAKWLCHLGSRAYEALILANVQINSVRNRIGLPYRPYASWIKRHVKAAMCFISEFELSLETEARRRGHRGVICGHIHHPALNVDADFCYMNTGDWVESCSAIVEHEDGEFELLHWTHEPTSEVTNKLIVSLGFGLWAYALSFIASIALTSLGFFTRLMFASLRRIFALL